MNGRLSTLTIAELEAMHAQMRECAVWFRFLGRYSAAAQAKAVSAECSQHLLRREADSRQHIARQLSLAPRGAYE
jgi:hypothetical protein